MQLDRYEGGSRERLALAAMVTSKAVLSRVAPLWRRGGLLSAPWSNLVGGWCVDYYDRYGDAPGSLITGMYRAWAESGTIDAATCKLVEEFLRASSEELDRGGPQNDAFLLDAVQTHLDDVALDRVCEAVRADRASGKLRQAKARIEAFAGVEMRADAGVDVFTDEAAVDAAFSAGSDPLVEYPGDLGRLVNAALVRDSLVAFMGPNKRGKSYWLLDLAFRALTSRLRVAFFEVGDMSKGQVVTRMGSRCSHRPFKSRDGRWPCVVRLPRAIRVPQGCPLAEVDCEEQEHDGPLTPEEAKAAFKEFQHRVVRSSLSYFKLHCYPNSTISVRGIEEVLRSHERRGWVADVICVDYADILAPITRELAPIDQINETWRALRALSQTRHVLLATASQTNAKSFEARTVTRKHFAGNNLKFAEATAVFGLNQDEEEKPLGVQRVNVMVAREIDYDEMRCVHVAGSLAYASPAVCSSF